MKLPPLTAIRTVVSVLVLVLLLTFVKGASYNVAANPYYPLFPTFFPPYNQLFPQAGPFPEGPIESPRFRPADSASPLPQDRVFYSYAGEVNFTATNQAALCPRLPSFMSYPVNGQTGTSADQVVRSLFSDGLTTQLLNPNVFPALDPACGDFDGDGSVDAGDLTIVTKYACVNDAGSGSPLSTGLTITLPSGIVDVPPLYSLNGRLTGGGSCDLTGNLFVVPRGCVPNIQDTDAFATCP